MSWRLKTSKIYLCMSIELKKHIAVVLLMFVGDVSASTCVNFGLSRKDDPLAYVVRASDIVYVGEAVSTIYTTVKEKGFESTVLDLSSEFMVDRVLVGNVANEVSVVGNNNGDCGCNYVFEPGVEYLVFASASGGRYKTLFCEYVIPTSNSEFDNVEKRVIGISGVR